jgi:hypothetical protein
VGTAAEVTGIKSLDDQPFKKEWEHHLGYQLQKAYEEATRSDENGLRRIGIEHRLSPCGWRELERIMLFCQGITL